MIRRDDLFNRGTTQLEKTIVFASPLKKITE